MTTQKLSELNPANAIEAMLDHCGGILINIIRDNDATGRLGKDEDDILADFCERLLRRNADPLYLWQGKCQFTTWVALLFRRDLWTELRKVKKLQANDPLHDSIPALGEDPEEKLFRQENNRKLHECIQTLAPTSRAIIRDKMYHDTKVNVLGEKFRIGKQIYSVLEKIYNQLRLCLTAKDVRFEDL